jgi:hypothetical protein
MNEGTKFKVITGEYFKKQGKETIFKKQIIIALFDSQLGISYPHPITDFLYEVYHKEGGSINTELKAANVIVPFLNFILEGVRLRDEKFAKVQGICDLNIKHANMFLEYCCDVKGNKRKTLEDKEFYITSFYRFLNKNNILKQEPRFIKEKKYIEGHSIEITKLDFSYTKPDEKLIREKIKRKDMVPQKHQSDLTRKIIRLNYIREFLLLALEIVPDIAFGIALQFYAGLRLGEVVNLTTGSLKNQNSSKYGESGLIIEIRDRQEILFNCKSPNSDDQVKRERDQSALIDPILCYLYEHHINKVLVNNKKQNNEYALFLDSNGKPMRAHTFRNRFNKLKSYYLGLLSSTRGRYEDYKDFAFTKWSTHIGRGAFTNFCTDAGFSATQTAILRGDRSIKAMESYLDLISATFNISKAIGLLEPKSFEEISGFIDPNHYKHWKDVVQFAQTHKIYKS